MATIHATDHVQICAPNESLLEGSLDLRPLSLEGNHFTEVIDEPFIEDLRQTEMQIIEVWKKAGVSSYMLLGCDRLGDGKEQFSFQLVPYQKTFSWFGKISQQLLVLWRFTFGGLSLSPDRLTSLKETHSLSSVNVKRAAVATQRCLRCAFCNDQVIDSQLVFEGREVQVLYNYAPIGLGGEKLHFLVVPKKHRPRFEDLSAEEHTEAFKLSQFVVNRLQAHFKEEPPSLKRLYLYHKTGEEAGQTVPHWHLHIVMTQNAAQDWLGRITVLRNMLLGSVFSFRLSSNQLAINQTKYTEILH